jgi:cyclopropane fatty-acyl-phospholipid synthase-like methyltransferase
MLGTSSNAFNNTIVKVFQEINPEQVIEFGCGQGKLGQLLTQNNLMPAKKLIGVQPLQDESQANSLKDMGYNQIISLTIEDYLREYVDTETDMFVAMDVFEHLKYADMISAIDQLLYNCNLFLLIHPSKHPQKASGNHFDAHRTSFELQDIVSRFEILFYNLTGFAQISAVHRYHFTLMRGHMNLKTYPPIIQ